MRVAAIALVLAAACVHGKSELICPEYRNQFCITGQECAMSKDRGCSICHCRPYGASLDATSTAMGPVESTLHP